jgi:hypothetical protein
MEPNRYQIEHVRDFLSVPEDRIDACLEEFKEYLGMARDMMSLVKTFGEVVGEEATGDVGAFVWIDDGKKDRTVTIKVTPTTPETA